MKLSIKSVAKMLQSGNSCTVYVYLNGDKLVYDSELLEGCVGKLSNLSSKTEGKAKKAVMSVQVLPVSKPDMQQELSPDEIEIYKYISVPKLKITNKSLAVKFVNYEVIQQMIVDLIIKSFEGVEVDDITLSASFRDDLGLDSLDVVDIATKIEEKMGVSIPDLAFEWYFQGTFGDVCKYLYVQINEGVKK